MSVQFTVENYRSFRDPATLNMVASPDRSLPANLVPSAYGTGLNLLKSAAIYGANASGKSNLIDAISFMRRFVLTSSREGGKDSPIGVTPFKLDAKSADEPTRFEAVFLHEGVQYTYGFAVDARRVAREWLHSAPRRKRRILFERMAGTGAGESTYKFGPSWKGGRKAVQNMVRPNVLFLSVAAQLNIGPAQTIVDWFGEKLKQVSWWPMMGGELAFTSQVAHDDSATQQAVLGFLQQADFGITGFDVEKKPFQESKAWRRMPEQARKAFPEEFRAVSYDVTMNHDALDAGGRAKAVSMALEEESDGTQKLFALAGPWHSVFQNGCTLVVDELDARLHPLLTQWLIQQFHDPEVNPNGAQLVFTTHDASLLDSDLLRRDQLWFTQKDQGGASELFSLWDFKKTPRKGENIRAGYLHGKYGAIPILQNFHS